MSVDAHVRLRVVEAGQHADVTPLYYGDVTFPSPLATLTRHTRLTGLAYPISGSASERATATSRRTKKAT